MSLAEFNKLECFNVSRHPMRNGSEVQFCYYNYKNVIIQERTDFLSPCNFTESATSRFLIDHLLPNTEQTKQEAKKYKGSLIDSEDMYCAEKGWFITFDEDNDENMINFIDNYLIPLKSNGHS